MPNKRIWPSNDSLDDSPRATDVTAKLIQSEQQARATVVAMGKLSNQRRGLGFFDPLRTAGTLFLYKHWREPANTRV